MQIGISLGISRWQGGGGGGGAPAPSLFAFELLNDAGSTTITSVQNLRIQLSGTGIWHTLASAGAALGVTLTIARHADGDKLQVSGWPGGVVPAGTLIHFEQKLPEEPNNPANQLAALFARRVGDTGPINPSLPGIQIAPTVHDQPVGVLP